MHKHYVINEVVEFHPATSKLRDLKNPEHVVVLNSPAGRCLLLLIERAGTIVTQQEFMDIVWQQRGMLVSPNTYYQNISILRKGLRRIGFSDDPVVTIPRIGLTLASDTQIKISDMPCTAAVIDDVGENTIPLLTPEPVAGLQVEEIAPPYDDDTGPSASQDAVSPDLLAPVINERKRWFLLTTAVVVCMLAGTGIVSSQAAQEDRYFDHYRFVVAAGDCRFFVSKDIQTDGERAEALSYGKRFTANCKNYPWVYINRYTMLPRASVIRCNRAMTEPNRCISDYFIEDH